MEVIMKKLYLALFLVVIIFSIGSCGSSNVDEEIPSDLDYEDVWFEGTLEFNLFDVDQYEIVSYTGDDETIILPDTYQNIPITKIGDGCFQNQNIIHVKIGKYVKEISQFAFANNSIIDLIIPSNVEVIGDNAFLNNPFLSIIVLGEKIRFNDRWEYIGFPFDLIQWP